MRKNCQKQQQKKQTEKNTAATVPKWLKDQFCLWNEEPNSLLFSRWIMLGEFLKGSDHEQSFLIPKGLLFWSVLPQTQWNKKSIG